MIIVDKLNQRLEDVIKQFPNSIDPDYKHGFEQGFILAYKVLQEEKDKDFLRLKKHDRRMRDNAHEFNSEIQSYKKRRCKNCKLEKGCVLAIQVTHRPTFSCSEWEKKETDASYSTN